MGWSEVEKTEKVERYLKALVIDRDLAEVRLVFATGPKSTENSSGTVAHIPVRTWDVSFSFAELVGLGIAPSALMDLDGRMESLSKVVHDVLVAKGKDGLA